MRKINGRETAAAAAAPTHPLFLFLVPPDAPPLTPNLPMHRHRPSPSAISCSATAPVPFSSSLVALPNGDSEPVALPDRSPFLFLFLFLS